MPAGDLFELVVVGRHAGALVLNTFGFAQVGSPAGDPAATLAGNWNSTCMTAWRNLVSGNYAVNALWVNAVAPAGAARYELNFSPPLAGNVVGEALPPQNAGVITWRTALAGRSYRGRTYVPAIAEGQQTDGTLSTTWQTNAAAFVSALVGAFITNAATNNFRLVVISRVNGGVARPTPIGTNVVNGSPRPYVYNQDRRTIGRGA